MCSLPLISVIYISVIKIFNKKNLINFKEQNSFIKYKIIKYSSYKIFLKHLFSACTINHKFYLYLKTDNSTI